MDNDFVAGKLPSGLRLNGDRYVTGGVRYLDDGPPAALLHMAFLRSAHAHALIGRIDKSAALAMDGVRAVMTGDDVAPLIGDLVCRTPAALSGTPTQLTLPCLTQRLVRYFGEPIALVVADTEAIAQCAADSIAVEYDVLEPMLDIVTALLPEAPLQHAALADNVAMRGVVVNGRAAEALGSAPHVLEGHILMGRGSAVPLEPRGCVASWDHDHARLVVRAAIQQPHAFRAALARQLSLPESDIQVFAPPLGGAFGFKFIGLPEEPLTCLMALRLKRPVRWVESRAEALLVGAREYEINYRIGFDDTGAIKGLSVHFDANIGALSATPGPIMPIVAGLTFPGPYDVADLEVRWRAVMTNKGPWNGARGFGKEATCLVLESALDTVAQRLGLSPIEVRRRNLLRRDQFPHRTATMTIDSGDYQRALDIVLALSRYDERRASRERRIGDGRKRTGIGLAFELTPEGTDVGGSQSRGFETATVRVDTSGHVTVLTGVTSPGTGSETAIAQLVASQLGIPTDHVRVIQGDTDITPYGSGSFSSRAVLAGGTAAWLAAGDLRAKLVQTAAVLLQVERDAIDVAEGHYCVRGEPSRSIALASLAMSLRTLGSALPGLDDPQLEVTRTYGPQNLQSVPDANGRMQIYPTYSYSVHVAEVEVDLETGFTKLIDFSAVHDCGTVINQGLVDAQFHGAIVMGIGMAMMEEERYTVKGQPLNDSFKKYLLPRVKDLPEFRIGHLDSPSPFTALGTKGAGESGVGGAAAAIVSAIRDAVGNHDGLPVQIPMTPQRVLAHIDHAAQAAYLQ